MDIRENLKSWGLELAGYGELCELDGSPAEFVRKHKDSGWDSEEELDLLFARAAKFFGGPDRQKNIWIATTAILRNDTRQCDLNRLAEEYETRRHIRAALRAVKPDYPMSVTQIMNRGNRTFFEAKRFLEVWGHLRGRFFENSRNLCAAASFARRWPEAPPWAIRMAMAGNVCPFQTGSWKKFRHTAKGWRISFLLWKDVATRVGAMPLWKRMVAGKVVEELAVREGVALEWSEGRVILPQSWQRNRALRSEFWEKFRDELQKGRRALLEVADTPANRRRVIGMIAATASIDDHSLQQLALVASVPTLMNLKYRTLQGALQALMAIADATDWVYPSAIGLASVFEGRWQRWLLKQEKLGRGAHDASYWLPMTKAAGDLEGLGDWLFRFGERPIEELSVVAKNWALLSQEDRKLRLQDLLAKCRSRRYEGQKSAAFAAEAARWGVPQSRYAGYEGIYLAAQAVKEPFDTQVAWTEGKFTGRFLPRSDVRVGFFGEYTDCCQHFDHSQGGQCAISSVRDPFSQLFVVEEDGKIVAGSWVWESSFQTDGETYRGACFDNIEALGDLKVKADIVRIYDAAARQLAERGYRKVTAGCNLSDVASSHWESTTPLALPKGYSGYTDAAYQVLLAENLSAAPVADFSQPRVWVRGALEQDLSEAEKVAVACYPSGFDYVSLPDGDRVKGLVLVVDGEVAGYGVWSEESRYVSDLAVLEQHRRYSLTLLQAILPQLADGGWWTAEARHSTSLRLLRAQASRGRIKLEEGAITNDIGGESTLRVRFKVE